MTRNPNLAQEVVVNWDSFSPIDVSDESATIEVLLRTRVGTNADGTKCGGAAAHNNATGLRFYYDSTTRASGFDWTLNESLDTDFYFHSDGTNCTTAQSSGVTTRWFDPDPPTATAAKCKDSTGVNFAGGNLWKEIGTWALGTPP